MWFGIDSKDLFLKHTCTHESDANVQGAPFENTIVTMRLSGCCIAAGIPKIK
jgi:hypothetical protein